MTAMALSCRPDLIIFDEPTTALDVTTQIEVLVTIRDIVDSDSVQLRYPVGPDAEPFLAWRASMSDEEWVAWGAADDESWYAGVENDFGLDARRDG